MDFDDLTQHLLATFLNNNNGNNEYDDGDDGDNGKESKQPDQLKQHKFNYGNSLISEPTGIGTSQLLNLTSSSSMFSSIPASTVFPIAPLPKPEPLQGEPNGNILYDIFLDHHNQQINESWSTANIFDNDADESDSTVSRLYLWDFILGIMLAIVTLATVIGNLLVIAAILRERHLRSVGNYLVFSLAVADLMVACLVMPLGALYVVTGQWTLGAAFCDLWTVADVLCCTASILHLLAIAMDRFWAVTNVDYIHQRRNGSRIGMMIFLIWVASFIISLAPIFGWRDPDFPKRIAQQQCLISQDVTYQIFATCSSFYVPLLLILLLYWRIYKVARKRIRRKPGNKVTLVTMQTNSNASNPNVETKVLKGMNNMSKTSKRLAKYSAAKYLQKQGSRLASDMMSLDTDHQYLRASADSLASNVSNNPTNENGKAISDSNFVRKKMEESSTSSSKRFSITRTTMTSLSMSNNHSDPQQCSTMTSINGTNDYSIIIEEGSSSSSNVNANRPNTSTSANNVCVVNGVQTNGSSSSSSTAPAGSTMAPFDDRSDCHNLSSSSPSMHLANHNHQHHQHNHHCICQQPFNRHFHNEANNSMDGHKFANEDMTSLPDGDNNGNDDGEHQLYAKKEMNERMCDSPPPPPPSPPNRTTTVTTTTTTMTPALLLQHSMSKTNDVNQSVLYEQVSSFSTDRYRVDHSNQTTPCNTHADPYCDDDRRLVNSNVVDDVTHNENEKKEKKEMEEEEGKGKKVEKGETNNNMIYNGVMVTDLDSSPTESNLIAIETNYGHSLRCPQHLMMTIRGDGEAQRDIVSQCTNEDVNGDEYDVVIESNNIQQTRTIDSDNSTQVHKLTQPNRSCECVVHNRSETYSCTNTTTTTTEVAVTTTNTSCTNVIQAELCNNGRPMKIPTVQLREDNSSSSAGSCSSSNGKNGRSSSSKQLHPNSQNQQHSQIKLHPKESVESKRERKAAKTLAIITGVFVICWLPFFINALLSPLFKAYQDFMPSFFTDLFLWLGYINSCVNPIIYTIFSPDFRTAFKKMLLGKTVRSPKGWTKGNSRV